MGKNNRFTQLILPAFFLIFCGSPTAYAQVQQLPLSEFDTILGFYHPKVLSEQALLDRIVVERLGTVASGLQAAAANEIANLSISAAGTQYFFGRDRMFYVSENLGTYYIEPPWTTGAGNGSVGISTSYLHFTKFQGQKLDDVFDFYDPKTGNKVWESEYDLSGQLTSFSFVYGVSNRLDLGLIVPLVYLEGKGYGKYAQITGFPAITDFSESATDVADMFLRAKYELVEVEDLDNLFSWTIGLDLKLNNGDRDKMLGTGDLGCRFRTGVGKRFGRFYPVMEVAYNLAGVKAQDAMTVKDRNGGLVTFPTGVDDGDFDAVEFRCGLPMALIEERWTMSVEYLFSHSNFAATSDLGVSTRIKVQDQFFVQLGVRIPLNDQGLRTDFIPTIGGEFRF